MFSKQMMFSRFIGISFKSTTVCRNVHASSVLQETVGNWKVRHGLPIKGREYGPLTDRPDWSYADGRPAPLTVGRKREIKLQKEYCDQIRKLTQEVDECMDLNRQVPASIEEATKSVIRNRLKAKGDTLV